MVKQSTEPSGSSMWYTIFGDIPTMRRCILSVVYSNGASSLMREKSRLKLANVNMFSFLADTMEGLTEVYAMESQKFRVDRLSC